MITFAHPLAPTVSYDCELKRSIALYAADHLHEYEVFLIEADTSKYGIGMEVVDKSTGSHLGVVSIH